MNCRISLQFRQILQAKQRATTRLPAVLPLSAPEKLVFILSFIHVLNKYLFIDLYAMPGVGHI